jgi:ABC-2 type transport system permease protein
MAASSASGTLAARGAPSPGARGSGPSWARGGAAGALVRRALRDARTRTLAFAYLFAIYAYIQPAGFRHTYPTLPDRLAFAHGFAGNDALRLFYGYPYDVVSVGGYSAWRVGGTLAIAAAVFGVLAAVRALRTEEDTGRLELVLAGTVARRTAYLASLAAIATGVLALWLALFAGYLAGGLPVGGSAYLALASVSVVPVFVGVGALVSQLAPTRRIALELGSATVGLFLLARVVADTVPGLAWLRWATPLGWAEELRPFAGARPLVLALPVIAAALALVAAARIAAGRDLGTGVLPAHDSAPPRPRLLSSASAQALREERTSLIVWLLGAGAFAFILGMVSTSVSSAGISKSLQREIAKLGSGSIFTPTGYLAFVFIFFVLVVSLFACAQIGAAREEEIEARLQMLLSQPLARGRWLGGRLLLAAAGAGVLSLAIGLLTWAGAASQGASVPLAQLLEAGVNCLPVGLLFLGVAALAYATVPRASAGIAYALIAVAFMWDLLGSLLGAPRWLVELTPFEHVGLVPAQPFRGQAAAIMIGIGVLAALAALALFRRRDLVEQ